MQVFRISVNFRHRCIAGSQTVPYSTQTQRSEPHVRKNFGGVDIYIQVSPPETPGKGSKGFCEGNPLGSSKPKRSSPSLASCANVLTTHSENPKFPLCVKVA